MYIRSYMSTVMLVMILLFSIACADHDQDKGNADAEIEENNAAEEENNAATVMDNARLHELLQRIDPDLQGRLGLWSIQFENFRAQIITDENADRMRVIVPIVTVEDVEEGELLRLMQANFDSALDARYCVANGTIWSAFIHQLSILSDEELLSGLAQAITLASSFGSTYSSGALVFRGGDSADEQRKYYESIIEKGLAI